MTGRSFDPDPRNPAAFAWVEHASWYHYLEGYQEAIRILLDRGESEGTVAQDPLVFPIVFLGRHLIELRLKELVGTGNRCLDVDENAFGHDLRNLWQSGRRAIVNAWPTTSRSESHLSFMDDFVAALVALDPQSTSFRYPTNPDGLPSLPEDLRKISLRVFVERVDRASSLLDAATVGIQTEADLRAETDNH